MMRRWTCGLALLALAVSGAASASTDAHVDQAGGATVITPGTPAIDPRDWRGEIAGPATEVLTIGSSHLSQMNPVPSPALLTEVVDRLVAFHPDIVTAEGVSGEQCETLAATPDLYDGAAPSYCWDASAAQAEAGQSGPQARIAIAATLADWPSAPTPADRRRLAALFIVANERASALVQWLQLPASERVAADGITPPLLAVLTELTGRMNETYSVAAVVAARLGQQRIYLVDDHSSDAVLAADPAECEAVVTRMWQSPAAAALHQRASAAEAGIDGPEAMLAYYRDLNRPETLRGFIDVDHRAAVGSGGAGDCGRRYLAWWETRNLRMVGNIRAAMGTRPGGRVLNIVGASHKPYYDLYLSAMADAVIVDAQSVLD